MRALKIITFLCLFPLICTSKQIERKMKMDSLFNSLNEQNQFSGTVLVSEHGKIVIKKGYGFSNEATKQVNDENTIFELASCSKQFTAAAIVILKRQGKLNYSDPITKYFPELEMWKKVSVSDLLRHTSGIPEFMADMEDSFINSKIISNEDVISFYAMRKDTLTFAPSSKYRYCNTNYALLASIVERVTNNSLEDFLVKNVFRPLNMTNTFIFNRRLAPRYVRNLALGYMWPPNSFDKIVSDNPLNNDSAAYYLDGVVGHAKVNSTVVDLLKWVNALKNNKLFTRREFEEITEITETSLGRKIMYGFGLDVAKGPNKFSFGHTGNWDGFVTFVYHNVVEDRTIIILQNFKMGVLPYENIVQILGDKPLKVVYPKMIKMPDAALAQFVGTYINSEDPQDTHIITSMDGHLIYNSKHINWNMRFMPVGDSSFQAIRSNGGDGRITFSKLDDGSVRLEMRQDGELVGEGFRQNFSR